MSALLFVRTGRSARFTVCRTAATMIVSN